MATEKLKLGMRDISGGNYVNIGLSDSLFRELPIGFLPHVYSHTHSSSHHFLSLCPLSSFATFLCLSFSHLCLSHELFHCSPVHIHLFPSRPAPSPPAGDFSMRLHRLYPARERERVTTNYERLESREKRVRSRRESQYRALSVIATVHGVGCS